jgi:uncharacterized protein YkwD
VLRHLFRVATTIVFAAFVVVLRYVPAAADVDAPTRKVFVPLAMTSGSPNVSPPAPTPQPQPAPPQVAPVTFEQRVADLINVERAERGLSALVIDDKLILAARVHSQDMADKRFFSHTGSDGSDAGDRIAAQGYAWTTYGENIAAGYATPESVVEGWMKSEGHRDNILNPDMTELGVGYITKSGSPYTHYWTNVLAAP